MIETILGKAVAKKKVLGAILALVYREFPDQDYIKPWYCGYVIFDGQPLPKTDEYHGLPECLSVHGGITYGYNEVGRSIYGFDCAHAGDENNSLLKDRKWLFDECLRMKMQLEEASKYDGMKRDDWNKLSDASEKIYKAVSHHPLFRDEGYKQWNDESRIDWVRSMFAHGGFDNPVARWEYQKQVMSMLAGKGLLWQRSTS